MLSSLSSKGQNFEIRGLLFHYIKCLKNRHPNLMDLLQNIKPLILKSWPFEAFEAKMTYKTTNQRLVEVHFGRYQKNILQE